MNSKNILVLGDIILDHDLNTEVSRVSPEAPVPVALIKNEEFKLGGSANVALGIKKLLGKVELLGIVGNDQYGERLRMILEQNDIKYHLLTESMPTIRKSRVKSAGQQLLRLDYEENFDSSIDANLLTKKLKFKDFLVISDYAKGTIKLHQSLINTANTLGVKVLVDPKGDDFSKYKSAYLIKPNLKEFEAIVGQIENSRELVSKGQKLIKELGIVYLLVTCGSDGMYLLTAETHIHVRHRSIEVFDVTGAGDTVIATLSSFLAEGLPIEQAVDLASSAASVVVQKYGTSFVERWEIATDPNTKLESQYFDVPKIAKERVVFTNGCFDLLHVGHIRYLEQASELGDLLIVGLNSDASVKKIKGASRPITSENDRKEILEKLKFVSKVIIFDEETPENLIKEVQPDVLVKGAEYSLENIVGHSFVKSYGGSVVTIQMVADRSTSKICDEIIKRSKNE